MNYEARLVPKATDVSMIRERLNLIYSIMSTKNIIHDVLAYELKLFHHESLQMSSEICPIMVLLITFT